MLKKIVYYLLWAFIALNALLFPVSVSGTRRVEPEFGLGWLRGIGLGGRDPREIAVSIINIFLGLLGLIAVVVVLYGGFKWMTAMGNEEKVGEAQKLLVGGVIGLVIITSAYAVSRFVITQLLGVVGR